MSEGLRLGYGVCQRLQRVSPNDPIYFKSSSKRDDDVMWKIPAGTPVGMTCALVHMNPDIFPEPLKFSPERWVEDRHLDRYLLSFSKGSRQCLGIKYETPLSFGLLELSILCDITSSRRERVFIPRRILSNMILLYSSLAYAELHIGIAALIRRFGHSMSLYQTTTDNVELARDFFVPWPKGERNIQVIIN